MKISKIVGAILITLVSVTSVFIYPVTTKAAVVLTDDFAGTTINTVKWTEIDSAGLGGTVGDVRQNEVLTIANSFSSPNWGQRALVSKDVFAKESLELSVRTSAVTTTLFGYGDYNFTDSGTTAFVVVITPNAATYLRAYSNGSYTEQSCGVSFAEGTNFKLLVYADGFGLHKNGSNQCTFTNGVVVDDRPMFLQSINSGTTFDNVSVDGTVTTPVAPDAPTSLNATGLNVRATLSWTAPASDGGSAVTDYLVEYKLSSEPTTWSTFADGTSTSTSATVTGLTNNSAYDFRVSATNAYGTSVPSATDSATPVPPTVPDAPTIGAATGGAGQASVTFSAPAFNGDSAITSYTVTSSPGGITATGGSSPITVTGLTNETAYTFTVKATNAVGDSAASAASNSVTPSLYATRLSDDFTGTTINTTYWSEVDPGGIGGTVGDVRQNGSVTVTNSYSNPNWGLRGLVSQDIYLADSLELTTVINPVGISILGYGDIDFTDVSSKAFLIYVNGAYQFADGPVPNVDAVVWDGGVATSIDCGYAYGEPNTYKLKVTETGFQVLKNGVAQCSVATDVEVTERPMFLQSNSSSTTFDNALVYGRLATAAVSEVPSTLTATALNASASLAWTVPSFDHGSKITDYVIEYKLTSSGVWLTFADGTSRATTATVTGLANGFSYDFRVSAINSSGTSAPSATASATTDGTAPTISNIVATPSDASAVITWTTNELASSFVQYGRSSGYDISTAETDTAPRVLSHSVTLPSLVPCASYFYRVKSNDANSNLATSASQRFVTTGCVGSAAVLTQDQGTITDAAGGAVELNTGSNSIGITIPAGAAGADAVFQIKQLDQDTALDSVGIPTGVVPAGDNTYDLKSLTDVETAISSFSQPITITLDYQDSDVTGLDESTLDIYHYSSGVWSDLSDCVVDPLTNSITCSTTGFSVFSLFASAPVSSGGSSGSVVNGSRKGVNILTADGTIYTLTADGKRRPYTSAGAYLSYGFNTWANVVPARTSELALPVGEFIPPRDGSIICSDRGSDKGTCYLITGAQKAGFTSNAIFKALGFSYSNALYGDVSFLTNASNIATSNEAHRKGVLVNNKGTLQVVGYAELIGIPSMAVLSSWGYNPITAVIANSYDKLLSQTQVLSDRLAGVLGF